MSVFEDDYQDTLAIQREAVIRAHLLGERFAPGTAQAAPAMDRSFRASVSIDGSNVGLPEQVFHIIDNGEYIQNTPISPWPFVRFSFDKTEIGTSDRSVVAHVVYTRLLYALSRKGNFALKDSEGNTVGAGAVESMDARELENLLSLAKIYRKLSFIEEVFQVSFPLPDQFLPSDLRHIEILFRGITEGEFWTRCEEITLLETPTPSELRAPPFTAPGPFSGTSPSPYFGLLGKNLLVGPICIRLDRSAVANPREMESLRQDRELPRGLRLIIYDSQIRYRFENYARRPPHARQQRLEQFKTKLAGQEPSELVELIHDPLISDVSAEGARQIATGWLQFHDFPDRYCAQLPTLEQTEWRVPIWVTYPGGRGAPVEDAFVDVKSGVITVSVSVEELRRLGKSAAQELLHAG